MIYVVEIGGANCTAGVYMDGVTVRLAKRRTPQGKQGGSDGVLETVVSMVNEVSQSAPSMHALAVSFSSFIDLRQEPNSKTYGPLKDHEAMISAPHVNGIRNLPFFSWIARAGWNVPIHVENDVNSALRSAIAFPTAVSVNLGTGVGAAIKRDNRIMHMPNTWSSYQMGHGFRWNPTEALTHKCHCGSIGCLEAAIGAWGLTDRYGVKPEKASPEIYRSMREDVIEHLSPAIGKMIERSGIDTVLLSGRAAHGFNENFDFIGALQERIQVTSPGGRMAKIELVEHGDLAGLHGVALAALDYKLIPEYA